MAKEPAPSLTLVIPALNEEEAVAETLCRARVAMQHLRETTELESCEVILVDDGSTDRTLERAKQVPGVTIVHYASNRGYGRAIETGYAVGRGTLLAFMDADGTCDPLFLEALFKEMKAASADIVLGCRLHAQSRMPLVRRIGNTLYAWLLSAISGRTIRDTASGMRLLKRTLLPLIHPLPGGLSYTPAMSARCVLDPRITIREVNMSYAERQGASKLSVLRDGINFLRIILTTGVFYTPLRIFGGSGLILGTLGLLALVLPWLRQGRTAGAISLTPAFLLLSLGALLGALGLVFHFFSKQVIPQWPTSRVELWLARCCRVRYMLLLAMAAFLAGSIRLFTLPPAGAPALQLMSGSFALYLSVLLVFVAAGVFIVNELSIWTQPEDPTPALLRDIEVFHTGVEKESPAGDRAHE